MPLPHFLRALSSPNYRLFFAGQSVSLFGNWLTTTAAAWLAYELSRSAFVAGLVPFANQIPVLFLAPVMGIWGDRMDRRRLLLWLQFAGMLPSLALMATAHSGHLSVPVLLALVALRGLVNAAEFPTRQSFIVELVTRRDDLANAIALNSSMFNVARLLGPTIAGLAIVATGPAVCFALDALTFAPLVFCLLRMQLAPRPRRARVPHPLDDLREGLRYTRAAPGLRAPILMVAAVALAGFGGSVLAPVFARDVFHADARVLGHMFSAVGAGALVGALVLGGRRSAAGLGRWIGLGAGFLAVGQTTVALSHSLPLTLAALTVTGLGAVLGMAGCNTLVQARVADDKRSRVMGLFAMGQGMFPVGSLLIGSTAALAGPRVAVGACACACALAGVLFARSAGARDLPAHEPTAPLPATAEAA